MYSADQIIPPNSELSHKLEQWSEDTDSRTWNIANVTNELIEELENSGIPKIDIYKAVAVRCKGNKVNTIRRWAECAADFDYDAQAKFASLLSFNHFKAARRLLADGYTPYLEYPLEWCVEGNDDTVQAGRFHTVGEMLAHFLPTEEGDPIVIYWGKIREKLSDNILMWDNDTERGELTRAFLKIEKIWRKNE